MVKDRGKSKDVRKFACTKWKERNTKGIQRNKLRKETEGNRKVSKCKVGEREKDRKNKNTVIKKGS